MGLFIVGLGLNPPRSITVEALEIIKTCTHIFLEIYTNSIKPNMAMYKTLFQKDVKIISRQELEESKLLEELSAKADVGLLILGDPLFATTHIELLLRMKKAKVVVEVFQNASIINGILQTGLQGYKFGRIVSLPWEKAKSPYTYIKENKEICLHTLLLLDVKREDKEAMTAKAACKILLDMESKYNERVISPDEKIIACSQLGSKEQKIIYSKPSEIKGLGNTPHCIILPGNLHFLEEEFLDQL